ncbi:MAG: hypothetical protein AB7F28_08440 [Candidatus Margulisiibacteriota bacterium]
MFRRILQAVVLGACVLLCCGIAVQALPQYATFTGTLRGDHGLLTGPYPVTVGLYSSNNTLLWEETHPSVTFTNGYFSISIGSKNSTPISSSMLKVADYLQLTVE